MSRKEYYSAKQLAELAGVSVRTLHVYDNIDLLKPSSRTGAGYRMYGEAELLRLQQILFYKLLGFSLQEIATILDDPEFDLVNAMESHKVQLLKQRGNLDVLLETVDKTIHQLKSKTMLTHEDLYEGLPKEQAEQYRHGAIQEYGVEAVQRSENHLKKMTKEQLNTLKEESLSITKSLAALIHENPTSQHVQELIAKHYACIREFWGTAGAADKQAEAYQGLGDLYVADERFTKVDGKPNPEFAVFMQQAMRHFASHILA